MKAGTKVAYRGEVWTVTAVYRYGRGRAWNVGRCYATQEALNPLRRVSRARWGSADGVDVVSPRGARYHVAPEALRPVPWSRA